MLRISSAALMVLVLFGCGAPSTPDSGAGGGGGGEVTCPTGQTRCGSTCVNLKTSNLHCGTCSTVCDSMSQCVDGSCFANDCFGADCADGQVCFGGQCLHRACIGVNCPAGSDCVEGECVSESCMSFTCPSGLACISGCCEDVQCSGVVCSSGSCQGGRCVAGPPSDAGIMCGVTGGGGGSTGGGGGATGGGGGATGGGGGATGGGGGGATGGGGGATGGGGGATGGGGGTVDAGTDAGVDAGVDAGPPPPVITFSTQFDGVATPSTPNSQVVYGRITNLTVTNAKGCTEIPVPVLADGGLQSPAAGVCASAAAWVTLPDGTWTYDNTAQLWRQTIPAYSMPAHYRFFAKNVTTDAGSAPANLELTGPTIIFSDTIDGPAKTDFRMSAAFYGRITGLTQANGITCRDQLPATNCQNQANFLSPTTNGWTWDATRSVWGQSFPVNFLASGDYLYSARNTQDQSRAVDVLITVSP